MMTYKIPVLYFGDSLDRAIISLKSFEKTSLDAHKENLFMNMFVAELRDNKNRYVMPIRQVYEVITPLVKKKEERNQNYETEKEVSKIMRERFGLSSDNNTEIIPLKKSETNILRVYLGDADYLIINNAEHKYSDSMVDEVVEIFKSVNNKHIISVKNNKGSDIVVDSFEDALEYIISMQKELNQE